MASPLGLAAFGRPPSGPRAPRNGRVFPSAFVPWLSSSRAAGRSGPPTSRAMERILWRRAFAQRGRPWPRAWGPPFPPSLSPGPWPAGHSAGAAVLLQHRLETPARARSPLPLGLLAPVLLPLAGLQRWLFPRRRQCSRATPLGFHASWPGPPQSAWRDASLLIPDRPFRERSFGVTQTFSPSGPMGKGLWP